MHSLAVRGVGAGTFVSKPRRGRVVRWEPEKPYSATTIGLLLNRLVQVDIRSGLAGSSNVPW